jgi:hypothetical protein
MKLAILTLYIIVYTSFQVLGQSNSGIKKENAKNSAKEGTMTRECLFFFIAISFS